MASGADEIIKKLTIQQRRLKQLNASEVSVGAIKAVPEHTPEELQKIVRYNEFGTAKIPARSFLRGAVYRNSKYSWRFVSREAVKAVVAGRLTGNKAIRWSVIRWWKMLSTKLTLWVRLTLLAPSRKRDAISRW